MGKDLYNHFAYSARPVFEEAEEVLGVGTKDLIFSGPFMELRKTEHAQPAILTCSIATLRALEHEFGFQVQKEASFVLGHSLGEYTALVASNAISFPSALRLVQARGKAMAKCMAELSTRECIMVAVVLHLQGEALEDELKRGELVKVRLAEIEASFQLVLSGTLKAVEHACEVLNQNDLAHRASDRLPVSAPFHTSLLSPAAAELGPLLKDTHFERPVVPFVSNVTAGRVDDATEIGPLLEQQVTKTVQWHRSVDWLRREGGVGRWLCFGPGRTLANLIRKEFGRDVVR
ncbi:FabD/lysophospholipase-like protein [Gonapodya prolifera JEL478]|uniref:[acyl-carrier-protein] S-malonyltransferase n=1 Tax=Gonapodya prolifera (strain JEL478) TaxID=1344416 RepID=A0A139AE28_GONPJ|nr:FabD/lysophospholipase-like protein [Gonapodya prolifera JEL478]|eukprot:KXS14844.1 FabD/lysophospholipase-like protein [Gonapodya prolifera JEL478]